MYTHYNDKRETDFKRLYKYFNPHYRYGYYFEIIYISSYFAALRHSRPIINLSADC